MAEQLLDKDGLTEEEFLAAYDVTKFERPSVTVDIIIIRDNKALLIKRGGHPCIGRLAFPGGFCEMNEDLYTAAARELKEETGLTAKNLRMLRCFSRPDRDPRTRIITAPFLCDIEDGDVAVAGDDASDASWYTVGKKEITAGGKRICEITLSANGFCESVKVSVAEPDGMIGDAVYTTIGKSPLAGDHAEILCLALDELERRK